MASDGSDVSEMNFIRGLASSDRKQRTACLELLKQYLVTRDALPDVDAQKLWKGLFYALWMTDRPLPQQELARHLSELVLALRPSRQAAWLRAFWPVLAAQWTTQIDVLRLDKFLLLVRRVFAAHLRVARQRLYGLDDADGAVDGVLAVLRDLPFDEEGDLRKMPAGIRLHVLDLWVDGLEKEGVLAPVEESAGEEEARAAFVKRLGDLVEPLKRCPVKPVRERAADSYDDARLPWGTKTEGDDDDEMGDDDGEDEEWGGIDD